MRGLVASIVALALGLAVAIPADGHRKSHKTRVTIEAVKKGSSYAGDVLSSNAACERRRRLRLWYDNPMGEDSPVGKPFRSNRSGHWKYALLVGVDYYAVARRAVKTPGNHRHVCRADRSPTT